MGSKRADMQAIFGKLSEKNKDILILLARSMKVAQETTEQACKNSAIQNENCSI